MRDPHSPDLHTVVCVKIVPKPEEIRVDPQTKTLERADARSEINPPDMNALEMALTVKDRYGGRISLLSMGPPFFEPHLRAGLAMGADHVTLLSDQAFAGADTLATTYTLAQAIRQMKPVDLIICGVWEPLPFQKILEDKPIGVLVQFYWEPCLSHLDGFSVLRELVAQSRPSFQ